MHSTQKVVLVEHEKTAEFKTLDGGTNVRIIFQPCEKGQLFVVTAAAFCLEFTESAASGHLGVRTRSSSVSFATA